MGFKRRLDVIGGGSGRALVEILEPRQMMSVAVGSLSIVDANAARTQVGTLINGSTLDLSKLGNFSVLANPTATVSAINFSLDGKLYQNESYAPYDIHGDVSGTPNPWSPAVGSHVLTVTPYVGNTAGTATTVDFTVIKSAAITASAPPIGSAKLTGNVIGTAGSYQNLGNIGSKAFDGNISTFFDAPTVSGGWVGLDFGSAEVITQIQYVPRSGYANRMTGGLFQGSNTADFSSGVSTIYTITTLPVDPAYNVKSVTNNSAFRYVRYLGPANGFSNVAEIEFDGHTAIVNPWTDLDIGSPAKSGSAIVNSNGTISVSGGGADIWNETDSFNFDYQTLAGNGILTARIDSQTDTNSSAKGGIMLREDLNSDSRYVLLALTPSNKVYLQARTATHTTPTFSLGVTASSGVWLQLRRTGSSFAGYTSNNGTTWALVGSVSIPMVNNVSAGMCVTAHDNTMLSTCVFSDSAISTAGVQASVWSAGAVAPMTRWESETFSYSGKMYVFGGFIDRALDATSEGDVYDPVANKWSYLTKVPTGSLTHAAVSVVGNLVYLVGGDLGTFLYGKTKTSTAEVLTYNLTSGAWGTASSLPVAESCGGLADINNKLYYYGGLNANDTSDVSNTWMLDLSHPTGGWVAEAAMPDARNHIGSATINGIAYAVGGGHLYNQTQGNDAQVDAYNPVTNKWAQVASLPMPWSSLETTTFVVNGKIVIVGGQTNGGYDGIYLNNIEEYNPATNQWSAAGTLPEANEGESAAYLNNELIVADGTVDNLGGWSQDQTWINTQIEL